MKYEIKILTDKEFDKLPYPEASMSLGLADTKKGKAYVRYTHSHELNKYLIDHELEHLTGEDRDDIHHGGEGVYYKGFGNIFSALGQAAAGAGRSISQGAGNIMNAAQGAGRSISGIFGGGRGPNTSASGVIGPMSASRQGGAATGYNQLSRGQLMSSRSAMAAANPTGRAMQNGALSNWNLTAPFGQGKPYDDSLINKIKLQGEMSMPQTSEPKWSSQKPFNGIMPKSTPSASQDQALLQGSLKGNSATNPRQAPKPYSKPIQLPGMSFNVNNLQTGGAGGSVGQAQGPGPGSSFDVRKPQFNSPSSSFSPAGRGVGTSTGLPGPFGATNYADNAISSAPNVMPTSGQGGDTRLPFGMNQNQIAGTALAGFGQMAGKTPQIPDISQLPSVQRLAQYNFRNFQELDPALQTAINNDFDRIDKLERERLIAQYKSLRPGADIESDSSFRRDMFELDRMQGQRRSDAMAKYRFDFIGQQLQISQAEMQQYQTLAEYDINTIMMQLGVDAQSAQNFKDTFGTLGGMIASPDAPGPVSSMYEEEGVEG